MKQGRQIKRFLALALVMALVAAAPAQASVNNKGTPEEAGITKEVDTPITLEITGLTDGKVKPGDKVTFKASGGTDGEYYLVIDVDGTSAGARIMKNGELTLTSGVFENRYEDYVLPFGLGYTVYAFRKTSTGEREYSKAQEFSVAYQSPEEYKLVARGVSKIYTGGYVWSLPEPPILYKNGKPYKTTAEMPSVMRFKIYTEQEKTLVCQDGMIKDIGGYDVTVYELFKDDDADEFYYVEAEPVRTWILSREIRVDQSLLDGGRFTVSADYDGESHGIDASQVSVAGMAEDEYSLSYHYLNESSNTWEDSTVPPTYVNPGKYTVDIKATFPTSKLVTASAVATISIKDKGKSTTTSNDADTGSKSGNESIAEESGTKDSESVAAEPGKKGGESVVEQAEKKDSNVTVTAPVKTGKSKSSVAQTGKKIKIGKVTITSLKNKKGKKAKLTFKKLSNASGYEVLYGTKKSLNKNSKTITTEKNTVILKALKKKKACYVKVRAYGIDTKENIVYGKYSSAKKVRISK
ncbi:MAG: hypothetical protein J1F22_04730 [Lachnospiraceae bacterium]|nr:hypothetical protein [Lachnospiraceae bacterium]